MCGGTANLTTEQLRVNEPEEHGYHVRICRVHFDNVSHTWEFVITIPLTLTTLVLQRDL